MTNDESTAPRRPWQRLHRSTYVVALLATATMVVLVVPGAWKTEYRNSRGRTTWLTATPLPTQHGWPWVFLQRPPGSVPSAWRWPLWMRFDAWHVLDRPERFSAAALIGDGAIALVIIGLVMAAFEVWRRRRARLWQFSLREMFILVAILAMGFACEPFCRDVGEREGKVVNEITVHPTVFTWVYNGPEWLYRLCGPRATVGYEAITEAYVRRGTGRQLDVRGVAEDLGRLKALRQLTLYSDGPPPRGLESLNQLSGLRTLRLDVLKLDTETLAPLSSVVGMESLQIKVRRPGRNAFRPLSQCRQLKQLHIEAILECDIGFIVALDNLESVQLVCVAGTFHDLSCLEGLPRLKRLSVACGGALDQEGIRHISRIERLEWLDLGSTAATDADTLAPLRDATKLRRLYLPSMPERAKFSAALQQSLPSCEIETWQIPSLTTPTVPSE